MRSARAASRAESAGTGDREGQTAPAEDEVVTPGDLPEKVFAQQDHPTGVEAQLGSGSLKTALTQPERQLIVQALEANSWNRQNTAKALGINRTTLYKKMKRYNIDFESVYKYV